jgi:hypothetical protein
LIDAGPSPTASNATVRIVEPTRGAEVFSDRPVEVAVQLTNGSIARSPSDPSGGHLHLYEDGRLQQMPYSTEAEVTLTPGAHELRVEYVDSQHVSFSP